MLDCAKDLKFSNLDTILQNLGRMDDDNRLVMPMFFINRIILNHILLNKKNILVIAERRVGFHFLDNVLMLFVPDSESDDFVYHEVREDMPDELFFHHTCQGVLAIIFSNTHIWSSSVFC